MKSKSILNIIFLVIIFSMVILLGCKKSKNTIPPKVFEIGQNYQGGVIAYVDGTGLHGLIAP